VVEEVELKAVEERAVGMTVSGLKLTSGESPQETSIVTFPLSFLENLMLFDSKLAMICVRRVGSPKKNRCEQARASSFSSTYTG
jgi:hypothetical protein